PDPSESIDFANVGSFIFSMNSGSLSRSFPIFQTDNAATITPIKHAGTQTFIMDNDAPGKASTAAIAAVAALIGLPVNAKVEAITEALNGRSGLILVLADTSAITGNSEYTRWAVPAKRQSQYTVTGAMSVIHFGFRRIIFSAR